MKARNPLAGAVHLTCVPSLAQPPGAAPAAVALKVATASRLRPSASPEAFDTMEHAEFCLLTSALCDLVVMVEAPIGVSRAAGEPAL